MATTSDKDRYEEMCRNLNMDEKTQKTAWSEFESICENYTIEGDKLHWLACALYVACRSATVATVGGGQSQGNSVSLTQILRCSGLSLIQFFHKINNWMDMVNTDRSLRQRIEALERKFEVTSCVFKKYDNIFRDMFNYGGGDDDSIEGGGAEARRGRKSKAKMCSPSELYRFCWTLYIYIKGNYPAVNGDLVNSHHLLLCCMDTLFAGALINNRRKLLNPKFQALPQAFQDAECDSETPPCIIEFLCKQYNGITREAKAVREHYWRPHLKNLHASKVFRGDEKTFMFDLFEMPNFLHNNKSISQEYENFVLSKGEFDERIFLGEKSHQEIGTPSKSSAAQNTPFEARSKVSRNLARHFEKASALSPPTPLTGRNYLPEKDTRATPVSNATQSVIKLQSLMSGCHRKPSASLASLLQSFEPGCVVAIETRLEGLGKAVMEGYCETAGDLADFAQNRVTLATVLYYKLLESVLNAEKVRLKETFHSSISMLLGKDVFHTSLFGCCVEIVLFSYNSQCCFPWILDILKIPAYHFYKVIEVIIKEEKGLSRSLVKHLNQVEEQILDCLAWQSGSPLYASPFQTAPSYEDVAVVKTPAPPATATPTQAAAPLPPQAQLQLQPQPLPMTTTTSFIAIPAVAPAASAQDRFSSPIVIHRPMSLVESAPALAPVPVPVPVPVPTPTVIVEKPKQTGSMGLFYRKVYHLAHLRLSNLCERLEFDESFHQKIWTCFEHSLVHQPHLMRDRHLDQLMMCAVYVMAKVHRKDDINFQKIMEHYRHQPQAKSHIYRSVLIKPKEKTTVVPAPAPASLSDSPSRGTRRSARRLLKAADAAASDEATASPAPVPPVQVESDEQRGDIVGFYNKIYIPSMKGFVVKFFSSATAPPPLSPLPVFKKNQPSPKRKVSAHHCLYLSPQNASHAAAAERGSLTPRSKMLYCFSQSPAKKLKEMNEAVAARIPPSKHLIVFNCNPAAKRTLAASPFAESLRSLSQEREDANSRDSMTNE